MILNNYQTLIKKNNQKAATHPTASPWGGAGRGGAGAGAYSQPASQPARRAKMSMISLALMGAICASVATRVCQEWPRVFMGVRRIPMGSMTKLLLMEPSC